MAASKMRFDRVGWERRNKVLLNTLPALFLLHELKHCSRVLTTHDEDELRRCEAEIASDILKRYQILEERLGDAALAPLHNGICTGCNMHQPRSGFIELASQIYECHYCRRLLYNPEDLYD
jgi:predicted  nucleic acid-binding Zn-ribbon protein